MSNLRIFFSFSCSNPFPLLFSCQIQTKTVGILIHLAKTRKVTKAFLIAFEKTNILKSTFTTFQNWVCVFLFKWKNICFPKFIQIYNSTLTSSLAFNKKYYLDIMQATLTVTKNLFASASP